MIKSIKVNVQHLWKLIGEYTFTLHIQCSRLKDQKISWIEWISLKNSWKSYKIRRFYYLMFYWSFWRDQQNLVVIYYCALYFKSDCYFKIKKYSIRFAEKNLQTNKCPWYQQISILFNILEAERKWLYKTI